MSYLALIADIRESKKLEDREQVQEKLKALCNELNADGRSPGLVSPFTVTLGDELQALFSDATAIWQLIFALETGLYPVRLRFGMGIGTLDTPVNTAQSIGMDGPVFHRAREAVEALRKSGKTYGVQGLGKEQGLVTSALNWISNERDSWRFNRDTGLNSRLEIFKGLLDELSVAEISKRIKISDKAIYKHISQGSLEEIQGVLQGISRLINKEMGAME